MPTHSSYLSLIVLSACHRAPANNIAGARRQADIQIFETKNHFKLEVHVVGALMIALLGTVVLSFLARQAHCRATASGAPLGTFRNLAIVAVGFVVVDLVIGVRGLFWSFGQSVTITAIAVVLGLYLPQVLAMTGNAFTHAAHGAARGVGTGLERSMAWALPKLLAVGAILAVVQFVPQLAALAVVVGGLYIILTGGFKKKTAKKKGSH